MKFQGLWCAVSDPVDPLAKTAYLESNRDENGNWDGLGLRPEQRVVIDDLKPGKDMADRAGVDFIAAGWTHTVPHIIETMQRISPHYCRTVAELTALLLDETEA